jgi:uncharacterized protein YeaO (DUF488 family)
MKRTIRSKSIFEKISPCDGYRVCVMRFVRSSYRYDLWLRDLAPSIELLNDWQNKKISWAEYEERYLDELRKKDIAIRKLFDTIKGRQVVTFLCAEKEDKYCHRRLLIEYLQSRFFLDEPVTPEEWNKLDSEEKTERVLKFQDHIDAYNEKGIAWGMSDLRRLAIEYQVPIPTGYDKNNVPIFEGFK